MDKSVPPNLYSSIVQCSMPGQVDNGKRRRNNCHMKHLWSCRRILYIRSIFEFLNNPKTVQFTGYLSGHVYFSVTSRLLGCDIFLDFVSSALRDAEKYFLNINSVSSVRCLIRNKFRQNKYNSCNLFVVDVFHVSVHLPLGNLAVFPLFILIREPFVLGVQHT